MLQLRAARVLRGRRGAREVPTVAVLIAAARRSDRPRCTTRSPQNKRRSRRSSIAGFVAARRRSSAWPSASLLGFGSVGHRHRPRSSPSALAFVSYWKSDAVALAMSRAKPGRPGRVRPAAQPRRGPVHRQRPAQARRLHRRRPGAERLRHRPQPQARRDRRHHRPAREDEPRRARRRAGPRAQPHQELRHPRVDPRGDAGRRRSRCCPTSRIRIDVVERRAGAAATATATTAATRLAIVGFVLLILAPLIAKLMQAASAAARVAGRRLRRAR